VDSPALLASLAALGYAAFYLALCAGYPFGNCRRCKGSGKRHNPFFGGGHRLCNRCAGTGRRVRLGRRVYEYLRSEHASGTAGDPRPGRR
jgi:hypothetical protein